MNKMNQALVTSVKTLLKETFEGPEGGGSWYTNSEPNSGIFGTVEAISAEEASLSVHGATIAAHVDHTRYYLWGTNEILRGEDPKLEWEESWKITTIDETRWAFIQKELHHEYTTLMKQLDSHDWNENLENVLGSLAHSAYHLGALRQMLKVIKKR